MIQIQAWYASAHSFFHSFITSMLSCMHLDPLRSHGPLHSVTQPTIPNSGRFAHIVQVYKHKLSDVQVSLSAMTSLWAYWKASEIDCQHDVQDALARQTLLGVNNSSDLHMCSFQEIEPQGQRVDQTVNNTSMCRSTFIREEGK